MPALQVRTGADLEALVLLPLTEGEEGEAGEAEEESPPNPVIPEVNEIIWAAIFFFALWAAMKYVLLPPIQRTRAERDAKIAAARDASDGASADLASVQAEYDAKLADARAEAASILEAARADADAERATVMGAVEAETAELRAAAAAEIADARAQALLTLRPQVADVATTAAGTVVGRTVPAGAASAAVDRLLTTEGGGR